MENELRQRLSLLKHEAEAALKESREADYNELKRRERNVEKILDAVRSFNDLCKELVKIGVDATGGTDSQKVLMGAMHAIVWKVANVTSGLE